MTDIIKVAAMEVRTRSIYILQFTKRGILILLNARWPRWATFVRLP
jgi:hypothetical protein